MADKYMNSPHLDCILSLKDFFDSRNDLRFVDTESRCVYCLTRNVNSVVSMHSRDAVSNPSALTNIQGLILNDLC